MPVPVPVLGGTSSYREQWLANQRKKQEATESKNTGFGGDAVDLLQMGLLEGVSGMADFVGAEDLANSLNSEAQEQLKTMTPEMQEAMSQSIVGTNENGDLMWGDGAGNWRTLAGQVVKTVGMLPTMMAPGGVFAKGLQYGTKGVRALSAANRATAAGHSASAGQAIARGATTRADKAAELVGHGVAADAVVGGLSERHVRESVMAMSDSQLDESPAFAEAYWVLAGDEYGISTADDEQQLSNQQRMDLRAKARVAVAEAAEQQLGFTENPMFHAVNLFGQGGANLLLSKAVRGGWAKTAAGGAAKGVLAETPLEIGQGAMEKYSQNVALQHVDPTIDTSEGVLASGLEEGIISAPIGGVTGAVGGYRANKDEQKRQDALDADREAEEKAGMLSQNLADTEEDYRAALSRAHKEFDAAKEGRARSDKYLSDYEDIKQHAIDLGFATEESFDAASPKGIHAQAIKRLSQLKAAHRRLENVQADGAELARSKSAIKDTESLISMLSGKREAAKSMKSLREKNQKLADSVDADLESKSSAISAMEEERANKRGQLDKLKKSIERRKQQERVADSELSVYAHEDGKFYVHDKGFNIKGAFDTVEEAHDFADPGVDSEVSSDPSRPPMDDEQVSRIEKNIALFQDSMAGPVSSEKNVLIAELMDEVRSLVDEGKFAEAQRKLAEAEVVRNRPDDVAARAVKQKYHLKSQGEERADSILDQVGKLDEQIEKFELVLMQAKDENNLDAAARVERVLHKLRARRGQLNKAIDTTSTGNQVSDVDYKTLVGEQRQLEMQRQAVIEQYQEEMRKQQFGELDIEQQEASSRLGKAWEEKLHTIQQLLEENARKRAEIEAAYNARSLEERASEYADETEGAPSPETHTEPRVALSPNLAEIDTDEIYVEPEDISEPEPVELIETGVPTTKEREDALNQEIADLLRRSIEAEDEANATVMPDEAEITPPEAEEVAAPAVDEVPLPDTERVEEPVTDEVVAPEPDVEEAPEAEDVAEPDTVVAEEVIDEEPEEQAFSDFVSELVDRPIKAIRSLQSGYRNNGDQDKVEELEKKVDQLSFTVDAGRGNIYHIIPNGRKNGSVMFSAYHFKDGVYVPQKRRGNIEKFTKPGVKTLIADLSNEDAASVSTDQVSSEEIRKYGAYTDQDLRIEDEIKEGIESGRIASGEELESAILDGMVKMDRSAVIGSRFGSKAAANKAIRSRNDVSAKTHVSRQEGGKWFIVPKGSLNGEETLALFKERIKYLGYRDMQDVVDHIKNKPSTNIRKTNHVVSDEAVESKALALGVEDIGQELFDALDGLGITLHKDGDTLIATRNMVGEEGVSEENLEQMKSVIADAVSRISIEPVTVNEISGNRLKRTNEFKFGKAISALIRDGGLLSFDKVTNDALAEIGVKVGRGGGNSVLVSGVTEDNYDDVMYLLHSEGTNADINENGVVALPAHAAMKTLQAHRMKTFGERKEDTPEEVESQTEEKETISKEEALQLEKDLINAINSRSKHDKDDPARRGKDEPSDSELKELENSSDDELASITEDDLDLEKDFDADVEEAAYEISSIISRAKLKNKKGNAGNIELDGDNWEVTQDDADDLFKLFASEGIEFSKTDTPNTKTTTEQLNAFLEGANVEARTVSSFADLPKDLQQRIKKQIGNGAENRVNAFYDPHSGASYIIANRVANKAHALSLLAHEEIGHHRFESMAAEVDARRGDKPGTFMSGLKSDLQKIIDSKSPANKKLQQAIKEITEDVSKRYSGDDEITREVISHLAERYADSILSGKPAEMSGFRNLAGKIAAMVRSFIRDKLGIKIPFKETDLMLMLAKAGRYNVKGSGPTTPGGGVVFSLSGSDSGPLSPSEIHEQATQSGAVLSDGRQMLRNIVGYMKDKADKTMPFVGSLINRGQWAEMLQYKLPQLMRYHVLGQKKDAYRSSLNSKDDELFTELSNLSRGKFGRTSEEAKSWSHMLHIASIYQVDPTAEFKKLKSPLKPNEERFERYKEAKEIFDGLPEEWQEKFETVRKNYKDKAELMFQALNDRASEIAPDGNAAKKIKDELARVKKWLDSNGPYFPLKRFGNYIVISESPDGERVVQAYERKSHAVNAAETQEREGYSNVRVAYKTSEVFKNARYEGAGSKLLDLVKGFEVENEASKQELLEQMNMLLLQAMPDSSIHKNIMMHRKGVAGYSEDAIRAFASSATMMNAHIANISYDHKRRKLLDDATEALKEMGGSRGENVIAQHGLDAMKRQFEMDQQEISPVVALVGQANFTWFIGPSLASAVVNTTQTPLVSLPMMAGRFGGHVKAGKALGRAMRDYMHGEKNWETLSDIGKSSKLNQQERDAIEHLQREGVIDMTQAIDLTAGGRTEQVGGMGPNFTANRIMKMVGGPFHYAEVFNRSVTALATYRLSRQSGRSHEDAIEDARSIVYGSHFDYSSGNRASIMKGNWGRVLFQFKQYPQGITYLMGRSLYLMLKDAERAIPADAENRAELIERFKEDKHAARVQFTGMMVGYTLAAGAMGMPLSVVMDIIQGVSNSLGDDDDPWDWKTDFMQAMADTAGKEWAYAASHGLGNSLLPFDLHSRIALNTSLWIPKMNERNEGSDTFKDILIALAGPTAGNLSNVWDGVATMQDEGNFIRGAEKVMPKALKDLLKTYRFMTEEPLTKKGDRILPEDLTLLELLFQASGFTPEPLGRQYFENERINFVKVAAEKAASRLKSNMVTARVDGDAEAIRRIQSQIDGFNKRHPKMRITYADIRKSVNARRRGLESTEGGIHYTKKTEHFKDIMRL